MPSPAAASTRWVYQPSSRAISGNDWVAGKPRPLTMRERDTELFTPVEAAKLSGLTLKAVNNAIDKKTIIARIERRNGHAMRLLDKAAIICPQGTRQQWSRLR